MVSLIMSEYLGLRQVPQGCRAQFICVLVKSLIHNNDNNTRENIVVQVDQEVDT